jgi:alpha-1,3-mannosyltransferase
MGVAIDDLRAEASRAGVEDAVTFHDTPSDDELLGLVSSSSFYVSASLYEGFGIAPIEAIAAGLTPVLSDIKPHRDTIEATGAGMVTAFDDPAAAADGIERLWNERVASDASVREGLRRTTLRFGWAPMAAETEAIYRCVLGKDARRILGLRLECLDANLLVKKVSDGLSGRGPVRLAFANANLLNLAAGDPAFRKDLEGFTIANDGIGVDIASKVLYGRSFPENLNGTDFCPYLLDKLPQPAKIFLYGGRPDVNERAATEFARRWPRHSIVGWQHGYHPAEADGELVQRIRSSGADLVLVAMGNPRQEQWIARHSASLPAVAIGVGALFDFVVGVVPRAPAWVQKARMEWVFRLLQEPGRLWRRYILGNPKFLWHVTRQYFNGVRA